MHFSRQDATVLLAAVLFLIVGAQAAPAQRVAATIDSTESVIDYTGTAPLHSWTGTSRSVRGEFVLDPNTPDSSRAVVRVPVASFDSGNDRRDRGMRDVTEADKYPFVEFRGTEYTPLVWGEGADGPVGRWAITGELTFHGRTHALDDTVEVRAREGTVQATAQFPVSLSQFEVERPGFMGFTVGDTIRVDVDVVGRPQAE
jgi:polyisoprenoid-binding protein YceI